ncbi:DUF4360 domain-containing protein [Kibdelosporangium persicum]|uniref:DUF4360 domain-containing protein n=1 Tax=Kibdelosporangium persicum TaxID=2698649 RepID=A0ABX2F4C8_9PSEU|nr:DUF4360 domain-containing protein [Kibdelosporangium persicum]NRN65855.1 hypothetical protein [Kibdelosporangium persicum]
MLHMLAAAGVALSIVGQPVQAAGWPSTPPPDKIIIDVATVNGSGCRPGTAAVAVSEDNEAFTVTYSEFLAQVGVGAEPTDWRKNCQISLKVHVPSGFTYAIAQADYRGFAHLERGATGLERANYYFQGMSPTQFISHPLSGSYSDNWQFTDTTDIAALVYHPCGELRNFNINTELRVSAGTSDPTKTTSFIAMDSTDGSIKTTYHFHWKTCPR